MVFSFSFKSALHIFPSTDSIFSGKLSLPPTTPLFFSLFSVMTSSSSSLWGLWLVMMVALGSRSCHGFGTFGFDVHHRYSDPVKGFLSVDDLPDKGSVPYYTALAHRDHLIHGRGLATAGDTPLTFADGNETIQITSLGFLHYANVSVGTPSSWYLVALDTGSDLFWLPCDCTSCVHGLSSSSGETLKLNIYSPNTSSTSANVPCSSTMCAQQRQCSAATNDCPYQISYLSNGTSSTGILVEDVLLLTTDDAQSKAVDAKITFGCGKVQTGSFLDGAAPNGLFGLGMENISVPSTLASNGLASNSFSLCFGPDGTGRISFGDKGSSDQRETPFNVRQPNPTYNVSVTQIIVGGKAADLEFGAIFDSGTSFTYLNDPAYTLISESFNLMAKENRQASDPNIPFEYCYGLSANQTSFSIPTVNLTMKGGDVFDVTDPIVLISNQGGSSMYCLAVVKSGNINIIGQNFMTGYKVVFDREKLVLGWKPSNCYDNVDSNTLAISPTSSHAIPPAVAVNPVDTSGIDNNTRISGAPRCTTGHSAQFISLTCAFMTILFMIFAI